MERRLLIAGMGGVIGRHLARGLESNYKVFGTIYHSTPPELAILEHQGRVTILETDLRQQEQAVNVISGVKPDVIVNLAGHAESNPYIGRAILDENMAILNNLLVGALSLKRGRNRFEQTANFVQVGYNMGIWPNFRRNTYNRNPL